MTRKEAALFPHYDLRPRLALIALWIAVLVWLPIEDRTPAAAITFGLLMSGLFMVRVFTRFGKENPYYWAIGGFAAGLAAGPLAVGLMIIKSGLHAHSIPDFSVADISGVLQRTPFFTIGGALLGAGLQRLRARD